MGFPQYTWQSPKATAIKGGTSHSRGVQADRGWMLQEVGLHLRLAAFAQTVERCSRVLQQRSHSNLPATLACRLRLAMQRHRPLQEAHQFWVNLVLHHQLPAVQCRHRLVCFSQPCLDLLSHQAAYHRRQDIPHRNQQGSQRSCGVI